MAENPTNEKPLSERAPKELFVPAPGKLIVVRNKVKDRTTGGILLTQEQVERNQKGNMRATVMCVGGPDVSDYGEKIVFPFAEGDEVMLAPYAGTDIPIPDTDMILTLCRFGEIAGKFLFEEPEIEDEPEAPLLYVPEPSKIITL